jgi:hypothetical protein
MNTYIYYNKLDEKQEPIGRVTATSLQTALEQIANIKRLSTEDIEELFAIQQIK